MQLTADIDKLPSKKLIEMLNLIKSREKCIGKSECGEFEVDFKKLKVSTLRALQQFVGASLGKGSNTSSKYVYSFTPPNS